MVAKLEGPQFSGGANIAIKCPSHTYEQTVAFYRDTLALPLIEEEKDGCIFQFGPNRLWIDSVPNLSHPDVWLELETNDTEAAASFLKVHGVSRRDDPGARRGLSCRPRRDLGRADPARTIDGPAAVDRAGEPVRVRLEAHGIARSPREATGRRGQGDRQHEAALWERRDVGARQR